MEVLKGYDSDEEFEFNPSKWLEYGFDDLASGDWSSTESLLEVRMKGLSDKKRNQNHYEIVIVLCVLLVEEAIVVSIKLKMWYGKIYCAKNYYPQVDTTNKSKRYLDVSDHCRRELTSNVTEYN